jgi:acyl-coenzyme A thioesterase 13
VVVQHGRTMALIRGTLESLDGKTVYAVCDHHKVNVSTLPEHIDLRKEMEEQRLAAKKKPNL